MKKFETEMNQAACREAICANQAESRKLNCADPAAGRELTCADLEAFREYLTLRERSEATIEKYLHDVGTLVDFLDGRMLTQETALAWKHSLLESGMAPSTVNVRIAAANAFFACLNLEIRLGAVRQQRRMFRSEEKDLSRAEYRRLVTAARDAGKVRLMLLFETICATGIRVSEIRHMRNSVPNRRRI